MGNFFILNIWVPLGINVIAMLKKNVRSTQAPSRVLINPQHSILKFLTTDGLNLWPYGGCTHIFCYSYGRCPWKGNTESSCCLGSQKVAHQEMLTEISFLALPGQLMCPVPKNVYAKMMLICSWVWWYCVLLQPMHFDKRSSDLSARSPTF